MLGVAMIADLNHISILNGLKTNAGIGMAQHLKRLDTVNLVQCDLVFFMHIVTRINYLKAKFQKVCLFAILVTIGNVLIQIIYGLELQKITRKTWLKNKDQI
jgi:hypothetical protein